MVLGLGVKSALNRILGGATEEQIRGIPQPEVLEPQPQSMPAPGEQPPEEIPQYEPPPELPPPPPPPPPSMYRIGEKPPQAPTPQEQLKEMGKVPGAMLKVGESYGNLIFGKSFKALEPWQQALVEIATELPIFAAIPGGAQIRGALAVKIAAEPSQVIRAFEIAVSKGLLPVELAERVISTAVGYPFKMAVKGIKAAAPIAKELAAGEAGALGKEIDPLFNEAIDIIISKVIPAQKIARGKTAKLYEKARAPAFEEVAEVLEKPIGEATVGKAAEKLGIGRLERAAFEEVQGLLTQPHKDAIINDLATNVNLPKAAERFNAMIAMKRIFSPLKYVAEHPKTAEAVPPNTPFRKYELELFERAWGKKTADEIAGAVEKMAAKPVGVAAATRDYLLTLRNIPYGVGRLGEKYIPPPAIEVAKEAYKGQQLQELMIDLANSPSPINPTVQEAIKRYKQFSLLSPTQRDKVFKILRATGINAVDALGIPKVLKFAYDLSYPFRQGAILGTRRPDAWAKAWKPMLQALKSDEIADKLMAEITSDTRRMLVANKMRLDFYGIQKGLGWYARPEEYASRIAEKIPGVRASQRAAGVFMNKLMSDVSLKVDDILMKAGESEGAWKDVGAMLNQQAGRGTLPKVLRGPAGDIINKLLTSPRFAISRFQWPTKIFSQYPAVRKEAARSLVQFAGVMTTLQVMGTILTGQREPDPRSSDWGKILVGNTRVDTWVGHAQIVRLLAQLAPYYHNGEIDWSMGSRKTAEGKIIKVPRSEILARFGESKMAPGIGAINILLSGKTYIGEKINFNTLSGLAKFAKEVFAPLAITEIVEAYIEEGIVAAAISAGEFVGFGVSTYKPKESGLSREDEARARAKKILNVPTSASKARETEARARAKALGY